MQSKSLIRDREQVKQVIDFTGLEKGKISPTDIDGIVEFNNKLLIAWEVKKENNLMQTGQTLLYERINDAWVTEKGKTAFCVLLWHKVQDTTKSISTVNDCDIHSIYYKKKWYKYEGNKGFRELYFNWYDKFK